MAISRDKRFLASADLKGNVFLWDMANGTIRQRFAVSGMVVRVSVNNDGSRVLTQSIPRSDKELGDGPAAILWNGNSGEKLRTFSEGNFASVLTNDGKHVLAMPSLWDAASGQKIQSFPVPTNPAVLSEDGKHLWTCDGDGIKLFDPATAVERCRLVTFDGGKDWLVVTPEGFFDCSEGALETVGHRIKGSLSIYDDAGTRRRFHRPGLFATLW